MRRPAYLVRGDEGDGRPGTPEATHTADTLHVPVKADTKRGRGMRNGDMARELLDPLTFSAL